jgi:leucine-rich repeat kinase 2
VEVLDTLERQVKVDRGERSALEQRPPDVFISYCWQNSHEAIAKGTKPTSTSLGWLDPRSLVEMFEKNGIECWLDIQDMSNQSSGGGVFGEITNGITKV